MKTNRLILAAIAITTLSGCQTWPRDAYIQGAKSTVNTPWGPMTQEAEMMATGKAAQNISLPDLSAVASKSKVK